MRGSANYVATGQAFYRLGYPGQGPGKVAGAYMWNRVLSVPEMNNLLAKELESLEN